MKAANRDTLETKISVTNMNSDVFSDYSPVDMIKNIVQTICADNEALLREIGRISALEEAKKNDENETKIDLTLKGCRRSQIVVNETPASFTVVQVQMKIDPQVHKNLNTYFETTLIDRELTNKIIITAMSKSQNWQELCQNVVNGAL